MSDSLNEVWFWKACDLTCIASANLFLSFKTWFLQQEPNINSYSDEGYKLDVVKGNIEFKNIHFNYPSRQDVKVNADLLKIDSSTKTDVLKKCFCAGLKWHES